MKYIITETTDKKFIGNMVEYKPEDITVNISNEVRIDITKKIELEGGWRLANSNYCIDIKGEDNG